MCLFIRKQDCTQTILRIVKIAHRQDCATHRHIESGASHRYGGGPKCRVAPHRKGFATKFAKRRAILKYTYDMATSFIM